MKSFLFTIATPPQRYIGFFYHIPFSARPHVLGVFYDELGRRLFRYTCLAAGKHPASS